MVRVENDLWTAAEQACRELDTTRSEVMREALRHAVSTAWARKQLDATKRPALG
jgi:predicted transcriptional regulator